MLVVVAVIAAALGVAARQSGVTRGLEQSSIDARFQIRGRTPPPPGFVLVAIDATTFNDFRDAGMKSQFPFPRRYYARVLDHLHQAGARVIAVDIQFTEPSDPADDNALYDAINRDRPVVLATTEVKGNGQTAILGGNGNLRAAGARPGDTVFHPDSDGIIRRMAYSIQGLRTYGVAIADAAKEKVTPGAFGGRTVPIDFAYPAGTVPTISLSTAWRGTFNPALVRGKIVVVGATAPTPSGHPCRRDDRHDVRPRTPGQRREHGHARAAARRRVARGRHRAHHPARDPPAAGEHPLATPPVGRSRRAAGRRLRHRRAARVQRRARSSTSSTRSSRSRSPPSARWRSCTSRRRSSVNASAACSPGSSP